MANDWVLLVDLKRQLRYPEDIVPTNLRPNIVIFSKESKVCVIMELTVPWEERIEEAHERKLLTIHRVGRKMQGQRLENMVFSV